MPKFFFPRYSDRNPIDKKASLNDATIDKLARREGRGIEANRTVRYNSCSGYGDDMYKIPYPLLPG